MPANTPLGIPYALPTDAVQAHPTAVDKPAHERIDALLTRAVAWNWSSAFLQTTATTWTAIDATNLHLALTIPAADAGKASVLVTAVIPNALSVNGNVRGCFSFLKNGAEIVSSVVGTARGLAYIVGAQRDSLAIEWYDNKPPAGTYNWDLAWKLDAAGTLQLNDVGGLTYMFGRILRVP